MRHRFWWRSAASFDHLNSFSSSLSRYAAILNLGGLSSDCFNEPDRSSSSCPTPSIRTLPLVTMSISPSLWAATERIKLAEHKKYGDIGPSRFDPATKRRRNVRAIEDPGYDITDQSLPANSDRARMIRAVQETLESDTDTNTDIARGAQTLADIVTATPVDRWYLTYCQVVNTIISAAKAIDGRDAGARLAKLIAALASRNDLTNPTADDLTYDIGDYWVRPVVVRPGAALIGESNAKIWSEMPSFLMWLKEELERFPGRHTGYLIDENWPGHSWENLTVFCRQLSRLHIQGSSPISAFWRPYGIQVLNFIRRDYASNDSRRPGFWTEAAIYIDLFGEEIYQLCTEEVKVSPASSATSEHNQGSGLVSANTEGFSSELWNQWLHAFQTFGASTLDPFKRRMIANAIVRMQNIESIRGDSR